MTKSLNRILCAVASVAAVSFAGAADQGKTPEPPASNPAPATSAAPARSARPVEKIDLNSADAATLQRLPGIDAKTAEGIVAARPFKSVEDFARVPGVGDARMEILKEQIVVEKRDPAAPAPTGRPSARSGEADTTAVTKVDLNTATLEELAALPEVGAEKAQAIIAARPFTTVEDAKRVKDVEFDAIKDRVTVSPGESAK